MTSPALTRPARTSPAARPRPARPARPPLRLVPAGRSRRPLAPFVTLLLGLLVAGLLALLLLNTWTAQDAFRLQALQHKQSQLDDTEQTLRQQADTLTDPAKLAARAQALHMVPGGPPAFVRPDGTLIVGHGRVTGHRQGSLLIVTAVPSPAAPVVRSSPAATASPPAAHPSAAHPSAALHRP